MKLTGLWIAGAIVAVVLIVALAACGGDEAETGATGSTPTGADFDRAFIDAMVPHHEGAIEMARAAQEAGLTVPALAELADDIIATQGVEIDQMKEWRADWFGSADVDPMGADALGLDEAQMGMDHDADALRTSGDVDTDFAQMMLTHHEGAIAMAKLANGRAEHREIEELADAIIAAQEAEIEVLKEHASGGMNH